MLNTGKEVINRNYYKFIAIMHYRICDNWSFLLQGYNIFYKYIFLGDWPIVIADL